MQCDPESMRFSAANAREMAARSVAARKAAEAKRTAWPASIPLQATPPADTASGISLACVRARLETLDALMSKAKSDREWDNLTRAYDRMFRVWCVLTKTPGPGNRKPAPEPRTPARPYWLGVEPTLPTVPVSTPEAQTPVPPSQKREAQPTALPTTRTVVTTATAATMPTVPTVSPNPKPPGYPRF